MPATPRGESRVLGAIREKASELVGRSPEPGLLMLRDLREARWANSKLKVSSVQVLLS